MSAFCNNNSTEQKAMLDTNLLVKFFHAHKIKRLYSVETDEAICSCLAFRYMTYECPVGQTK